MAQLSAVKPPMLKYWALVLCLLLSTERERVCVPDVASGTLTGAPPGGVPYGSAKSPCLVMHSASVKGQTMGGSPQWVTGLSHVQSSHTVQTVTHS